jgi:hypothetical protein
VLLVPATALSAAAQAPPYLWVQHAGGSGNHSVNAIAVGSDGTIVVGGSLQGNATFGTNTLNSTDPHDIFIAQYSSKGTNLWAQKYGSTGNINVSGIAIDPGGSIYVLEQLASKFTVLKLSSNGVPLWSQPQPASGSGGCYMAAICADSSGCYVAGDSSGIVSIAGNQLNSSSSQAILCHFNAAGTMLWVKAVQGVYGAPLSENPWSSASGAALDLSGNVYFGGTFVGTNAWGNAFAQTNLFSPGSYGFLSKFSPSGNLLWAEPVPAEPLRILTSDQSGDAAVPN